MVVTFTAEDEMEAKRLIKARDMACFIWELVHNMRVRFPECPELWEAIDAELMDNSIDIVDLVE